MDKFDYNLDTMALAKNYNNAIFNWIAKGTNLNDSILDFGAGRGEFCNRFKGYNNICAVEADESLRRFINCKKYPIIDEVDSKFDLIYAINVIEHIENDSLILSKIYQLLNNKGKLKIFVPAKQELFSKMDKEVGHFRRYEKDKLIKLFNENGFKINYCRFFDVLGYFATLAYKIIDKGEGEDLKEKPLLFYDKIIFPVSNFMDKITFRRLIGKNLILESQKLMAHPENS